MRQMPTISMLSIIDQIGRSDERLSVKLSWYDEMAARGFDCSLTPME